MDCKSKNFWIPSCTPSKDYKEDRSCYASVCLGCKYTFHGHKYRRVCKECNKIKS